MENVTIRYNISQNDAQGNGGAITVWRSPNSGIAQNIFIYGNTIYNSSSKAAFYYQPGSAFSNMKVINNNFMSTGTTRLVDGLGNSSQIHMTGNNYWSFESSPSYRWNNINYSSLDAWSSATNQEKLSGSDTGFEVSPQLVNAGMGTALTDPYTLASLSLFAFHIYQ